MADLIIGPWWPRPTPGMSDEIAVDIRFPCGFIYATDPAPGERVRLAPESAADTTPARHARVLCQIPGSRWALVRPEGAGAAALWVERAQLSPAGGAP